MPTKLGKRLDSLTDNDIVRGIDLDQLLIHITGLGSGPVEVRRETRRRERGANLRRLGYGLASPATATPRRRPSPVEIRVLCLPRLMACLNGGPRAPV
jgi:hypothetical protein